MSDVRLSKRPEGRPLQDVDAALWTRLTNRLVQTLTETLHRTPEDAARLAEDVRWTVEHDDRGEWMTMTFPDGRYSAVGGEWPEDHDSLLWYVDDVAHKLAGRGGAPCCDDYPGSGPFEDDYA